MAEQRLIYRDTPKEVLEALRHKRAQQPAKVIRARIDRTLRESGLSDRQLSIRFESLDDSEDPKAHRICRAFAEEGSFQGKYGLLLAGPPGCGKTTLAIAIMIERVHRLGGLNTVQFLSLAEAIEQLRPNRPGHNDISITEHPLTDISANGLVILDDLGMVKRSEWVDTQLYRIIDELYRADTPTVITTNVALKQVGDLQPALTSRFFAMTTLVEMGGQDFRLKRGNA